MKNTFEFARFVQVCRLTWQTQPILPYILLVAMVPLMFLFFFSDARGVYVTLQKDTPFHMFTLYVCICGWLYAGTAFYDLGRPDSASRYLMLPGSLLEKWLAKSLLVFIVFPLITFVAYNIVFRLFEFFSLRWFAFRYDLIDWSSGDMFIVLFIFYLALPAAYASGLFWKRFGVWKGLLFFFILFIILTQVSNMAMDRYYFGSGSGFLMQAVELPFYESGHDAATRALVRLFWPMAAYIPALLLLCSTYFFIKDKEL